MLYTLYMWALIAGATLAFGSALLLLIPMARRGPLYKLIVHGWAKVIVAGSRVRVTVIGIERLDPVEPYVFMANHQSYFDVISLVARLDHPVRFVAKKELMFIPVFGWCMWASGHVVINRSRHDDAVASLRKAAQKVRSGTPILVFPEGTRSGDHHLGPFKKGGFMLALEAGVPLVPVSISGSSPMMPKGRYTFSRSDVSIVIGDPILTEGLTQADRDQLIERTRKAIIANFPPDTPESNANMGGEAT